MKRKREQNAKIDLSKHPFDWIIHFTLCFVAIYFNQATVATTIFVAVMLEYEQWSYSKQLFTWEYFYFKVFGDLVADGLGIVVAELLHLYFNWGNYGYNY